MWVGEGHDEICAFRGGVCGAGLGGSKQATALVLEDLGKGLNQVSTVVRERSQVQEPRAEPAGLCCAHSAGAKEVGCLELLLKEKKRGRKCGRCQNK